MLVRRVGEDGRLMMILPAVPGGEHLNRWWFGAMLRRIVTLLVPRGIDRRGNNTEIGSSRGSGENIYEIP
jgi:hypothetical protein